jgi:hypothetical protein
MPAAAPDFLATLPVFARFQDVADPARYQPLPEGWALAMADVVHSTQAIATGKYKTVNMAGAAVITAVLNALGRNDYPFVFGGDGAAVAVPPEGLGKVRDALAAVARWIEEDLGLTMRTALVLVAAIRAAGRDVLVARFRASPDMAFAMFAGGGSSWAEAAMKAGQFLVPPAPPGTRADLTGLSCRWDPVRARKGHILSVIALPVAGADPAAFRSLVADVVAIGNSGEDEGSPLPPEGPRPRLYFAGVGTEARAAAPPGRRFGKRLGIIAQIVLSTLLHRLNRSLGGFDARRYAREVSANSDFRKFDDGLKMTLDVDAGGLARIRARLQAAAAAGVCRFGLHQQASALVTCIVPSAMNSDHMHFIDGAGGGYAQAALALKAAGGGSAQSP